MSLTEYINKCTTKKKCGEFLRALKVGVFFVLITRRNMFDTVGIKRLIRALKAKSLDCKIMFYVSTMKDLKGIIGKRKQEVL